MIRIGNFFAYRLGALLFFCVIGLNIKGQGLEFRALDSAFQRAAAVATQTALASYLIEMQLLAASPLELGLTELRYGDYHLRGQRFGQAAIACHKAKSIFDSVADIRLGIEARLLEIGVLRQLKDFDKASEIAAEVQSMSKKIKDDLIMTKILYFKCALLLDRGKNDSVHIYAKLAIPLAQQLGDSLWLAKIRYQDAVAYQLQGDRKIALESMAEIDPKIFEHTDHNSYFNYFNFLGMVYMSVEQNENARGAYVKAAKIAKDHELLAQEGSVLTSLGILYKTIGDTTLAISKLQEALKIATKLDQTSTIASSYGHLADIYIGLKNWGLAGSFARKALEFSRRAKQIRMESYALMRLAVVQVHQNKNVEALNGLALADSLTRITGNWVRIREINDLRAEASENLGDMEQALHFQRIALDAQDSSDYVDAKLFADSLEMRQAERLPMEEPQKVVKGNHWLWSFPITVLIGLVGLLIWKLKSRPVLQQPVDNSLFDAVAAHEALDEMEDSEVQAALELSDEIDSTEKASPVSPETIAHVINLLRENRDWTGFMLHFDAAHPGLMKSIAQRHPDITPTDMRILALSRLGLSTDELGELMGVSTESVKKARYRTRKRLGISADQSLTQYMLQG